jgi:hypothetical protein
MSEYFRSMPTKHTWDLHRFQASGGPPPTILRTQKTGAAAFNPPISTKSPGVSRAIPSAPETAARPDSPPASVAPSAAPGPSAADAARASDAALHIAGESPPCRYTSCRACIAFNLMAATV